MSMEVNRVDGNSEFIVKKPLVTMEEEAIGVVPMVDSESESKADMYSNYVNGVPGDPPGDKKPGFLRRWWDGIVASFSGPLVTDAEMDEAIEYAHSYREWADAHPKEAARNDMVACIAASAVLPVIGGVPVLTLPEVLVVATACNDANHSESESAATAYATNTTVAPTAPPTDPPTVPPTDPPTDPPTVPPTDPPTDPPTVPPTDPPTDPPTVPPTVINDDACDMFVNILGIDAGDPNWQGSSNITKTLRVLDMYLNQEISVSMSTIQSDDPSVLLNNKMDGKVMATIHNQQLAPVDGVMVGVTLAPGQIYDHSEANYGVMIDNPFGEGSSLYVPCNDGSALFVMEYDGEGKLLDKPRITPDSEHGFTKGYLKDAGKLNRDEIWPPLDIPDNCNIFLRREEWGELYIYERTGPGQPWQSKLAELEMHNVAKKK